MQDEDDVEKELGQPTDEIQRQSWRQRAKNLTISSVIATLVKCVSATRRAFSVIYVGVSSGYLKLGGFIHVVSLPSSKDGYNAIMVIVDRLTKRANFIATQTTDSAEDTANVFMKNYVKDHGLPKTIV
ncbi:Retrovirus Polyprotein [Phytophthora palmivora]|uniref:Retrovirus Polyprotein n=1 Tax=Phytophthora palmivora TaxID=4796 RepID=A0A2P4YPG1_9STRA|nr:Retrovirus Polyprotein [Phytophthora palmivora]